MSKFYFPDPFASPNICPRKSTFLRPRANETCQRKYRSVSKTMARLKWTIHRLCRCLFPRRLEKRKCNAWKGRNLRNISSGHAWKHSRSFQCHYQQANQRFPDTRMLRGTSERPLSAWHTLGARFRSVTTVPMFQNFCESFLNASEPSAGCGLTPGATISTGVKCLDQKLVTGLWSFLLGTFTPAGVARD